MTQAKPSIAIILPGGIGTGENNIGVPILERIIKSLSAEFEVTVFQLYRVNAGYHPKNFELISIHSSSRVVRLLKFFFCFHRISRQKKFVAVHGFWAMPCGFLAVVTGKLYSIKSLVSLQGGDAIALPQIGYGQLQTALSRRLVLWTLHHVGVMISPTLYLIDNLRRYGLRRKDVQYIPLGVDVDLFKFRDRSVRTPVQFLYIANLHPVKDPITLLKAFKIISNHIDCHLTLVGEGVLENEVKSLASTLNLTAHITFQKPLPYESLVSIYAKSDVLLHTSLSEGHPIVVEEAMSCGILVCGTKVGLLYDLLDHCVAVPVGDAAALAAETLQLLEDPERMQSQRAKAYTWARHHSMAWTISRFKETYNVTS